MHKKWKPINQLLHSGLIDNNMHHSHSKINYNQTDSEHLGYDDDNYIFDIPKVAPLQDKENTQKIHSGNKDLENLVLKPNLRENFISQIWLSPKKESMKVRKKKESALLQKQKQTSLTHESKKQKIEIGKEQVSQVYEEKKSNSTDQTLGAKHEKYVKRKISSSTVHESKKQNVETGIEQVPLEVSITVHDGKKPEIIEEKQIQNIIICDNMKAKKKCATYKCTMCPKRFSESHILSEHIAIIHRIPVKRQCKCPVCDGIFAAKFRLDEHMATAHKGRLISEGIEIRLFI